MESVAAALTWVAYAVFAVAGVALAVLDAWKRRLPDALVLPALIAVGGLLMLASLLEADWDRLVSTAGGAAALFAAYYLLAAVHPAGLGAGDVKLAALIGAALGHAGWSVLATGALLGFVLAGLGAILALIVVAARRGAGSGDLPFAPFMIVGAWIALLWAERILAALGFA